MHSNTSKGPAYFENKGHLFFYEDYPFCPECGGIKRCNLFPCQLAKEYAAFHAQHSGSSALEPYRSYGIRTHAKCYLCGTFGDPDDMTIECGSSRVAEGIGPDYQIFGAPDNLTSTTLSRYRENLVSAGSRWKHDVSVLIWAPTGRGKNYFVENRLLPYVQRLNELSGKRRKVLMLVNRVALKKQVDEHLVAGQISPLNDFTDVMTYQSLLAQADYLRHRQEEDPYVYVVCDEAHFFTSDAMFNADTDKILNTIEEVFCKSIRVYMTATPDECAYPLRHVRSGNTTLIFKSANGVVGYPDADDDLYDLDTLTEYSEERIGETPPGDYPEISAYTRPDHRMRIYHFTADYDYLDIQSFTDLDSLIPVIANSVVEHGEKWIVFVDNKKKLEGLETMICQALKDAGCSSDKPVLRVSADDKKDPRFQEMLEQEALPEGVYVLLTTSVLDNGVNIRGVQNIAVSTMDKVKCQQMVGRARVGAGERKTLYLKRFSISEANFLLQDIQDRMELYLDFADLYVDGSPQDRIKFLQQSLMGSKSGKIKYLFRWEAIKDSDPYHRHDEPQATLIRNKIAFDLTQDRKDALQHILAEMQEEEAFGLPVGDKFLAHQFSWFGKTYDPSVTSLTTYLNSLHPDDASAWTKIVPVAVSGQQNVIGREEFHREFVLRYELSYGSFDRSRTPCPKTYNSYLAKMQLPFRIVPSEDNEDIWECQRPSLAETHFDVFVWDVASTLFEQNAQKTSVNSIEKDFKVLHEYAVRCLEKFEAEGVVSAQNGKQPRIIDRVKLQEFMSNHEKDNVVYDPKTRNYTIYNVKFRLASQDDDVADSRQPIEPETTFLPVPSEAEEDVPSPASVVTADELARTYGIPNQRSIEERQIKAFIIAYLRERDKASKKGKKKKAKRNKYIDF